LKIVEHEHTRKGIVRDLYYVAQCLEDFGDKISHTTTINYAGGKIAGLMLSETKNNPVWQDANLSLIETTINNQLKENAILVNIPSQWKPQAQDFKYLELSGLAKGLKSLFRPIEPVPEDIVNMPKVYRSYIEQNGEPIAHYEVE